MLCDDSCASKNDDACDDGGEGEDLLVGSGSGKGMDKDPKRHNQEMPGPTARLGGGRVVRTIGRGPAGAAGFRVST